MDDLSLAEARRIALAAQGFAEPRPTGRVDRRHLRRMIDRIGVLQIDSVNVLVRSHELPLFSRLGPYPRDLLARMTYRDHELFEYWGHAASLLPIEAYPLFRWRMSRADLAGWNELHLPVAERAAYVETVHAEVTERGALAASELTDGGTRRGHWWGWAEGKAALEFLFYAGRVAAAGRKPSFERIYDLSERVIPEAARAAPGPGQEESHRALLRRAVRHLGIGTARDLSDYYRISTIYTKPRMRELVEAGDLVPVRVEGWGEPGYLEPAARRPRRVDARALVSPFDSLVWKRDRAERLYGMRVSLEIYVPAAKRTYGYYVLPFLLGDRLVARVDLKADREAGALLVHGAFAEPNADTRSIVEPLGDELRAMATWLGLDRIEVGDRGDLAPGLRRLVTAATP